VLASYVWNARYKKLLPEEISNQKKNKKRREENGMRRERAAVSLEKKKTWQEPRRQGDQGPGGTAVGKITNKRRHLLRTFSDTNISKTDLN